MKRLFLFLLITAISLNTVLAANLPPNALFQFPVVKCDVDGNITINVTHTGSFVRLNQINITAIENRTNITSFLIGNWSLESGSVLENYTPNDLLDTSYLMFKSNVTLPGKGDYLFFMQWTIARNEWSNKLFFSASCPGKNCYSDDDCTSGQSCVNATCEIVGCPECQIAKDHVCGQRCDDNDPTTQDMCNNNICSYKKSNVCRTSSDCDDGKQCTADTCLNKRCSNQPVKCISSIDPCIKGSCEEGIGCIYKTDDLCQLRQDAWFVRIWNFIKALFS